jgi:hypothetical protein
MQTTTMSNNRILFFLTHESQKNEKSSVVISYLINGQFSKEKKTYQFSILILQKNISLKKYTKKNEIS